jgi:transcriptional regulator with GAF, ATPase, and Fis domain
MPHELAIPFPGRPADLPPSMNHHRGVRAMVGASQTFNEVRRRLEEVASTGATVLLLGETGTGKGLLAQTIHELSPRRHRNFAVVDCGSLAASLIESELFGRERGAFTGAYTSQAGRFEAANGGTVFLDEIGDLPLELQPKLLRVLQEGQVERLGGLRTASVDVRIIAATNRDLAEDVRCGRFRRDLFYRLNVFPIRLPSLRQRIDDLPALVQDLCDRLGRELRKPIVRLVPGSIEALRRYDWPGNIRELENVIHRALIVARDGVLDLSDFVGEPIGGMGASAAGGGCVRPLADVMRDHMTFVLEQARWRIEGPVGAARLLGVHPSTLRSKMAKLGIERLQRAAPSQA